MALVVCWITACARAPAGKSTEAGPPVSSNTHANGGDAAARNVRLDLPVKFENATFVRYALGDDEVVQRRGAEAKGTAYGIEITKRDVTARGETFTVVTYQGQLSPPPLDPKNPKPVDPETYRPKYDVLYVSGAEILFPHRDGAASLVDRVVAAVRW